MGEVLNEFSELLDSYVGRDKIVRLFCYTTKLIAGIYQNRDEDLAKKFAIFSTRMSQTRANLRLFDDIPMLQYSIEYGLGSKEPDRVMAIIGTLTNLIDTFYYPIDKICWLTEQKLINVKNPERWDFINSFCWVVSIYLNLLKCARSVYIMQKHINCIEKLDQDLDVITKKQRMEMISCLRLTLDFIHAVSTFPKGILWGERFSSMTVGLIGTTSSFIGLYQYFAKKRLAKN